MKLLRVFILLPALLGLCSCNPAERRNLGETAVKEFHTHLNSQQYHDIYAAADREFREVTDEPKFIASMELVYRKLGKVQQARLRYCVDGRSTAWAGPLLTMTYDTDFVGGTGTEKFLWRIRNKRATLLRYDVNSDALAH